MAVSVVMAAYNGEKYIKEQIDSIIEQLNEEDEFIVSLDPSSDDSERIILEYPKIKLVHGPGKGVIKNFENGLKYVQNEFVFLTDQDDIWLEDKVKLVLEQFEKDTMVVVHDAIFIDENKNKIQDSYFAGRDFNTSFLKHILKNPYMGCCMCLRKEVIDKAIPFPNKIPMHDQYLGLVAELLGKTKFYEKPLLLYRRHGQNTSNTSHSSVMQMIKWRGQVILAVFKVKFCS